LNGTHFVSTDLGNNGGLYLVFALSGTQPCRCLYFRSNPQRL